MNASSIIGTSTNGLEFGSDALNQLLLDLLLWNRERRWRCKKCSRRISLLRGISGTFISIENSRLARRNFVARRRWPHSRSFRAIRVSCDSASRGWSVAQATTCAIAAAYWLAPVGFGVRFLPVICGLKAEGCVTLPRNRTKE